MAVALRRDPGQLCRAGRSRARARPRPRPEQVERSAASSLLRKAADKDDCADMVVTMCRTDTHDGADHRHRRGRVFH